jgi:hypothetical protein
MINQKYHGSRTRRRASIADAYNPADIRQVFIMKLSPALLLVAACLSACGRGDEALTADGPPLGPYRGVLQVAGGDLPFGLELAREDGAIVAYLINGPERARAPNVRLDGNELTMQMPGYPHRLEARFVDADSRAV